MTVSFRAVYVAVLNLFFCSFTNSDDLTFEKEVDACEGMVEIHLDLIVGDLQDLTNDGLACIVLEVLLGATRFRSLP